MGVRRASIGKKRKSVMREKIDLVATMSICSCMSGGRSAIT